MLHNTNPSENASINKKGFWYIIGLGHSISYYFWIWNEKDKFVVFGRNSIKTKTSTKNKQIKNVTITRVDVIYFVLHPKIIKRTVTEQKTSFYMYSIVIESGKFSRYLNLIFTLVVFFIFTEITSVLHKNVCASVNGIFIWIKKIFYNKK